MSAAERIAQLQDRVADWCDTCGDVGDCHRCADDRAELNQLLNEVRDGASDD